MSSGNEGGDPDIRAIERAFYRIEDGETDTKLSVAIEIKDVGCWIVKFSRHGVIVNNCDIVFAIDPRDCDASVHFKSYVIFWTVLNGGERFDDCLGKGYIEQDGSAAALELIKSKLFQGGGFPSSSSSSASSSSASVPSITPQSTSGHRVDHVSSSSSGPIKSGWLLKKRDIVFGWQCRFFVVYVGRVEYYIDQHDQQPRGVIQLFGAEIKVSIQKTSNALCNFLLSATINVFCNEFASFSCLIL